MKARWRLWREKEKGKGDRDGSLVLWKMVASRFVSLCGERERDREVFKLKEIYIINCAERLYCICKREIHVCVHLAPFGS